jgi:hypothetical protein
VKEIIWETVWNSKTCICKLLLVGMTDAVTSQNTDIFSWDFYVLRIIAIKTDSR